MATIVRYYDQHDDDPLHCDRCGWSGTNAAGSCEMHRDLLDISCPQCDRMLLIIGYPTFADVRAAAERGDARAIEDLAGHDQSERSGD